MQERREYFRINDAVSLNYRVVQSSNPETEINRARREYSEISDLKQALHCINARLDEIQSRLAKSSPLVAETLELINKKFAIQERLLGQDDYDDNVMNNARDVNLSANGVAFDAETPVQEGTCIKLEMVTYPEHHYIPLYAFVVSCDKHEGPSSTGYRIAVKYEVISDDDQETLINHIFRKQSEQLKLERLKQENDDARATTG